MSVLKVIVKFVKEEIEEFLSVGMHSNVCGLSAVVLERETKFSWIIFHSFRKFQETKELPHLIDQVVIDLVSFKIH